MIHPKQKRLSRHNRDNGTIHGSFRLMECFDTPSKRTVFGAKNSEHWDSFRSKYSSSFDSSQNFDREQHHKVLRRRYELQAWNHDKPEVGRRTRRWRKKWLLWIFLGCWKSRDGGNEDRCATNGKTEMSRKKRIPLAERYSDYFEKRKIR